VFNGKFPTSVHLPIPLLDNLEYSIIVCGEWVVALIPAQYMYEGAEEPKAMGMDIRFGL
jgi:hypothetical protein